MKKVLFVITSLEVGGIETYLLRFLGFSSGKLNSTVLCKGGRSGPLEDSYKQENVDIILFRLGYFSFYNYWKLHKYLKKENFDTICDFTGDFAGALLLVAKLANVKNRLVFYRGSEYQFVQTKIKMLYAKLMNHLVRKNATKILSNSKTALNNFHPSWKENPDFYEVIYNGIPLFNKISNEKSISIRAEYNIPENAFIIGHIGSYRKAKNHEHILKVASALLREYNNLFFILCGPRVKDSLGNKIKQMKINHRVILDNSRNDVPDLLHCFNAFYFPSLNEGQPNALLEAMSVGLPFVASNIDPIKEALSEKYYKYLTSPYDIEQTVELFKSFIEDQSTFPSDHLSKWTQDHFDTKKLFNKFLENL